jgi:glycosyltransferase involved in cell wall biosynthesis
MISVIVCSNKPPDWTVHERNVGKTIGASFEYCRMDNRGKPTGICAAYNTGVSRASGDILVFVHEDVFFLEPGWGTVLEQKFAADPALGLVGVAGTQFLYRTSASWAKAGRPFIRGRIVNEYHESDEFFMTVFSWDKQDAPVVAVDGLFFAIRRPLFNRIRFDEETFDKYHFYDLDICMQIRAARCSLIVTWDIFVKHLSRGNADDVWREYGRRFLLKHGDSLPASTAETAPDETKDKQFGQNYDLRGKAPRETIC